MTINYTELTHNMHLAIREAGYSLVKHEGVFIADNEAAVQAIIDNFDPLPQLRTELKEQLVKDSQDYVDAAILKQYPKFEVDTWQNQYRDASNYLADNNAVVPTLEALAGKRGITILEAANKVLSKAAQFELFSGNQAGERQRIEDLIDAAETVEALNAIPKFAGV